MDFELRKWRAEDAPDVARYANNENIARNLRDTFPYPYTLGDAESYIRSCMNEPEERKLCRAIEADRHVVGSIGVFLCSDVYRKSAELGYWLAEEYWGRGIMSEAARRICAEAFGRYDIVRIYAEPFSYNAASRKVLENAGFTFEGVMKSGVYKCGNIYDYCMYSLIKK